MIGLNAYLIVAAVLFAIYYANWTFGWVTPDDLDFYNPPETQQPSN